MGRIVLPEDVKWLASCDTVEDTSIGNDGYPKRALYSAYPIETTAQHSISKVWFDEIQNENEAAYLFVITTEGSPGAWVFQGLWHDIVRDPDDDVIDDIYRRLDELMKDIDMIVIDQPDGANDDTCKLNYDESIVSTVSIADNSKQLECHDLDEVRDFVIDGITPDTAEDIMFKIGSALKPGYDKNDIDNPSMVDHARWLGGLGPNDYLEKSKYADGSGSSSYKVNYAMNADYASNAGKVGNKNWDQFLQANASGGASFGGGTVVKHRTFYGAEFSTPTNCVITDSATAGGDNWEQIRPHRDNRSQVGRTNGRYVNGYFVNVAVIIKNEDVINLIDPATYTESNILDNIELLHMKYENHGVMFPKLRMKTKQVLYDDNTLNVAYDKTHETYNSDLYYGDAAEQIATLALALKQERAKFDALVLRVQALETQ